ncbi:MAG: cytochrome c oxidase subunit 3 [Cyclobacteriaceae bacterium]|nr:cytochrome c oxidase subunit 3 [Cyclobacteriaceae bacterium]
MTTDIKIVEEAKKPLSMHPQKFAMWLFIVSVTMLFMAWTSAYIVKRGEPGWSSFELPQEFWTSSVIIVLSSISLIWAQVSAKRDNLEMVKVAVSITTILGLAFLAAQWLAWIKMVEMNYYFTGMGSNTSSSFIYVLTGVHGLHLIGGIVFLLIVLVSTFRYKIHSKNMVRMEMCATYWHFLGGLWLYLFVFLVLNR